MKEFKGTWLMIKTGDDYSKPELIEFNENKVLHFGVGDGSHNGVLSKNEIWVENISDTRFELVNANRIRFFHHGKLHKVISETESITVDKIFEVDYERLEPTKTDLSKMDIEKLEFNVQWNNEHIKFVFNKDLYSAAIQEVNKRLRREGRKLSLENLDGTYFGAIYDNGVRETLIPIREISKEKLTLYGFPEKPYEITVP
ncbi:hypothetical protein [uncultured Gelidibacter sp.]|uniref:hypothetical protein n=1 Tax=uncultured Gelidibacter sp. TaxID=259318 RepID=UPI0026201067|nr:hypothetical protein [uncultured Gelidibacter sp.]